MLRDRLDRFTRSLRRVDSADIRGVHRTRVASRRLRELLPLLLLEDDLAGKLGKRLRDVTRRLGPVRELDVLLAVIDELQRKEPDQQRALSRVRDHVRCEHVEKRRGLSNSGLRELERVARKLASVAKRMQAAPGDPTAERRWRWVAEARIARRASALQTAINDAGSVYLAERLHRVRVALKKLRYGIELYAEAVPSPQASADLRTLKHAQDLLGRMHDLQVLLERVRAVQAALDPPNLSAWRELDALVTSLERACRRLHARYVRERATLLTICGRFDGVARRGQQASGRAVKAV
jgi:CHAD domain-containing protein